MVNQEFKANFSEKLLNYIQTVERETGRQVHFEYVDDFGSPGIQFAFRKDPEYLCLAAKTGISFDDPRIERSMAHEITHCLLIYGLGFYALEAKEAASDEDFEHLSLLSFIDDIVVNRIIQESGFLPLGSTYREMLNREIVAVDRRLDFYSELPYSTLLKRRYIASRYVLAWSATRYWDLNQDDINLITKYLKVFKKAYSMSYLVAKDIEKLILEHNVFDPTGHKKVIETLLKDWNLENSCTFKCYKT